MTRLTTSLCLTIAVLLGSAGCDEPPDFKKGFTAYKIGDYATALRNWTPLAEQGHATAQYNLGLMYRNGKGVPQNHKAAVKWYRLAAEQGNAFGQFHLGLMYDIGQGVLQDYKTAVKWYKLAAEQGDAEAQFNLGAMYEMGKGVKPDNVYAYMWYNIAASSGNETASKNRDIVAEEMTPSRLKFAQIVARECVRKKYKGC